MNGPANGREAHHQRAVQGYPEHAGRIEQLKEMSDRSAHAEEHGRSGNDPNPFNNITHGPWTPKYPGSYNQYYNNRK
jgi:hypothetical protein